MTSMKAVARYDIVVNMSSMVVARVLIARMMIMRLTVGQLEWW